MNDTLVQIDTVLARIEHLAEALRADPDGNVRRSASELRATFAAREQLEPAVARMRRSMELLRAGDRDECRREFLRRVPGLEHLDAAVEHELVPHLRRLGFEV